MMENSMTRTNPALFLVGIVLVGSVTLAPAADDKSADPKAAGPVKLTDEALRIHREALLIDGHNDLPWQYRLRTDLSFQNLDISRSQKAIHTDIPRLKQGG